MPVIRPLLPAVLLFGLAACSGDPAPPATDAADATATQPADGADPSTDATTEVPVAPEAEPADTPRIDDLVRADDTLATLQQRLGADTAVPEILPGAEGETMSGWTLFPADATRKLSVYLDESGEHPLMLMAGQDATGWTRSDGVRIGMTSQELAQLNGGPFGFMGFDWDYGGVVTDWRGGHLAPDGASAGPVTLCLPEPVEGEPLGDYPVGDNEFGSDDPRLLLKPARVCEFGVNIDPPQPARAGS